MDNIREFPRSYSSDIKLFDKIFSEKDSFFESCLVTQLGNKKCSAQNSLLNFMNRQRTMMSVVKLQII